MSARAIPSRSTQENPDPVDAAHQARPNADCDIAGLYVIGRAEFPMFTKCSGYDSFGCGRLWGKSSDAPRISGRKKPWCDECGGVVGAPYAKWVPRNHGPTWELRREDRRGHYVSPVALPIEAMGAQLYNCTYPSAPWPDRVSAPPTKKLNQKSSRNLPPGLPTLSACAGEAGLFTPEPRTSAIEYIIPSGHMSSYRKCTGWDISGCQRIWRQEQDAPRWSNSRKPWCDECGAEYGVARGKWIPEDHGPTWNISKEVSSGFVVRPEFPEISDDVYTIRIPKCGTPPPAPYCDDGAPRSGPEARVTDLSGYFAEFSADQPPLTARRGEAYSDLSADRNQNRPQGAVEWSPTKAGWRGKGLATSIDYLGWSTPSKRA